jgi:chorismate mutase
VRRVAVPKRVPKLFRGRPSSNGAVAEDTSWAFASSKASHAAKTGAPPPTDPERIVDLARRRDQLTARVAELQWDLGGLVYEMATRDRIRMDVLVRRAAELQELDAQLAEVERILRTEQTGAAGTCGACGAPHSSGAVYCWQCGQPILEQVSHESIASPFSGSGT